MEKQQQQKQRQQWWQWQHFKENTLIDRVQFQCVLIENLTLSLPFFPFAPTQKEKLTNFLKTFTYEILIKTMRKKNRSIFGFSTGESLWISNSKKRNGKSIARFLFVYDCFFREIRVPIRISKWGAQKIGSHKMTYNLCVSNI